MSRVKDMWPAKCMRPWREGAPRKQANCVSRNYLAEISPTENVRICVSHSLHSFGFGGISCDHVSNTVVPRVSSAHLLLMALPTPRRKQ